MTLSARQTEALQSMARSSHRWHNLSTVPHASTRRSLWRMRLISYYRGIRVTKIGITKKGRLALNNGEAASK